MAKRIDPARCCGVIVDVQDCFLSKLDAGRRAAILAGTRDFVRLLGRLAIPVIVTLEKPVEANGFLPPEIAAALTGISQTFEKSFFDLSREPRISGAMAGLGRNQAVIAGCETDVCVLQSCLGLLDQGYEVYPVEDLLFTASPDPSAAIARMKAEGAVFLTYKTLFYELAARVDNEMLSDMPGPG